MGGGVLIRRDVLSTSTELPVLPAEDGDWSKSKQKTTTQGEKGGRRERGCWSMIHRMPCLPHCHYVMVAWYLQVGTRLVQRFVSTSAGIHSRAVDEVVSLLLL